MRHRAMKADPFPTGGSCNAGCASFGRPPTHPHPESMRAVATANDDDDTPRPEPDASGRMSQMAGKGARPFYSIVVIDFIMSDIENSLADPSQEGSVRGIARPGRAPDASAIDTSGATHPLAANAVLAQFW
jgi:hypothetical protein